MPPASCSHCGDLVGIGPARLCTVVPVATGAPPCMPIQSDTYCTHRLREAGVGDCHRHLSSLLPRRQTKPPPLQHSHDGRHLDTANPHWRKIGVDAIFRSHGLHLLFALRGLTTIFVMQAATVSSRFDRSGSRQSHYYAQRRILAERQVRPGFTLLYITSRTRQAPLGLGLKSPACRNRQGSTSATRCCAGLTV